MSALEPAFPFIDLNDDGSPCRQWAGLTKREYFAALAMQGILSGSHEHCFYSADGKPAVTMADNYRYGAQIAVSYADAVILALNAEPKS